ncbi:MAG: ribonuclease P protein component [Bacteroidetes bacterium]|nr:ribonuclease P protein component [Bacteroidota bacterium]
MKDQKPHTSRFTFRKEERLCSQKIISGLFEPGFFISRYPFRIHVLYTSLPTEEVTAQVMFVVGKKRFKKAVDRNRIKRVMREMYRLNKAKIYTALMQAGKTAALAVIYTGDKMPVYKKTVTIFEKAVEQLCIEIAV